MELIEFLKDFLVKGGLLIFVNFIIIEVYSLLSNLLSEPKELNVIRIRLML